MRHAVINWYSAQIFIAALVLGYVAAISSANADDFAPSSYPVYYDVGDQSGWFIVSLYEHNYPTDAPFRYRNLSTNVEIVEGSAEWNILEYVLRLKSIDIENSTSALSELYSPNSSSKMLVESAKITKPFVNDVSGVHFLKKWKFNDSSKVLYKLLAQNVVTLFGSYSFEKSGNRELRSGLKIIRDSRSFEGLRFYLLRHFTAYIKYGLDRNWFDSFDLEQMEFSIVVDEGEYPVLMSFDGALFAFSDQWIPVTGMRGSNGDEISQFVESNLATVPGLSNVSIVELLCDEDQNAWGTGLATNPALSSSLAWTFSTSDAIKHVFTMRVGRSFVHYFLEDDVPSQLKHVYIRNAEDDLCLSTGPQSSSVQVMLESELVKSKILALWQSQRTEPK